MPVAETVRIEELRTPTDLEAVREHWRELAAASAHDSPYMLPEFLLPLIRRVEGRYQCRFLLAWAGRDLVGLAPVMQRRVARAGLGISLRTFPDIPPSPPCDILVRDGITGVEEAFLAHWLAQSDWDALEFPNAPTESPPIERLARLAAEHGLRVSQREGPACYSVPMRGPWSGFLASRSKKMRQNLRRGWRFLERQGAVSFADFPGDMDLGGANTRIVGILARSWKAEDDEDRGWDTFVTDLVEGFAATAELRVTFLNLDNMPIAFLLDVPRRDQVFAVHCAYDLHFQPGSPGQLLLARSIERCHDSHRRRYVTGVRDYLRHWGDESLPTRRTRISRGSPWDLAKLYIYDHLRERRVQAALDAVDRNKNARKRALNSTLEDAS